MVKIFIFLILSFCFTSCGDEDPLNVKVVDIKEPCECIDFAVLISKRLEELSPYVKPEESAIWDCGEYYVDSLATEEEREIADCFAKRNEIHTYCIEKFDHEALNKCAIEHPDFLNVISESHLGFAKNTYTMEAMEFYSVVGINFKFSFNDKLH
jgi:hypothetical protein